jgi:hypothetical protein
MNMKTLKTEAQATAAAVVAAEEKLLKARAGVGDVAARNSNLVRLLADLRGKVAALVKTGDLDGAAKLAQPIGDTRAAIEGAEEVRALTDEHLAELEYELVQAEYQAKRAFEALHQQQADELRAALVEDFSRRWRACFHHYLRAGGPQTFEQWSRAVMIDGNLLVADEHLGPPDLGGMPAHPLQSEAINFVRRRELLGRLYAVL